jgi:hypothetical protein
VSLRDRASAVRTRAGGGQLCWCRTIHTRYVDGPGSADVGAHSVRRQPDFRGADPAAGALVAPEILQVVSVPARTSGNDEERFSGTRHAEMELNAIVGVIGRHA